VRYGLRPSKTVQYRARNTTKNNQTVALRRMELTLDCCKSKETVHEIDRGVARECVNKRGVRFEIACSYSSVEFTASTGNARPRYTEGITRSVSFPTTCTGGDGLVSSRSWNPLLSYTKERRKPPVPHFPLPCLF